MARISKKDNEQIIKVLINENNYLRSQQGFYLKELTEKNKQIEELQHRLDSLQGYHDHDIEYNIEQRNKELEAQIEKMKCCSTCENCDEFGNCFNALKVCRECVDFCNWKLKEQQK